MPRPALHGYPDSPFTEKIRTLLGYTAVAYDSVEIPPIMPRPDLMALTGGYRRTPVLQIDADIYCDTALIAAVIDELAPGGPLHAGPDPALQIAAARWFDSVLFRSCVGLSFQPRALSANARFQDPAIVEAFLKDRAALVGKGGSLAEPLERAEATFRDALGAADAQLQGAGYLGGAQPGMADFSLWHCCWFIDRQPVLRDYFAPYTAVGRWLERMRAYSEAGHGEALSSADAVARAAAAEPLAIDSPGIDPRLGLSAGQTVEVLPTDYGRQPVRGALLAANDRRLSVSREDPRAGRLHVHFPRYGFEIRPAIDSPETGDAT